MSEKPRQPLAELLRELDEKLEQQPMPVGTRNRIELRIREHEDNAAHSRWRRWLPVCTFAAGAALVLAVIGVRHANHDDRASAQPVPTVAVSGVDAFGGFAVSGDGCRSIPTGDGARMQGDCRLVGEHMTVEVWEEAEVEPEGDAVRIRSGRALFDVEPVGPKEETVEIAVSHGVIEVVGTRFAVAQDGGGGHVDLFEGKIRFHALDGRVLDVEPGERHRWGTEAPQVAVADPPEPEENLDTIEVLPDDETRPQTRRRSRAERAAGIIARVEALRGKRRYREAVSVLRDALKNRWNRRTAEVMSYELGELLGKFLDDRRGACRHIAAHQRRFPDGRYHDELVDTLDRLRCE